MQFTAGQRWGLLGAVAGVILGGLICVVVTGVVLGDWRAWATACGLAVALWWGAERLFARRPERFATILGGLILCVVAIDWLYLGIVVPRLPALPSSPLWDISQTSRRPVRSILLTASVAATALIVWDLVWRQGKE